MLRKHMAFITILLIYVLYFIFNLPLFSVFNAFVFGNSEYTGLVSEFYEPLNMVYVCYKLSIYISSKYISFALIVGVLIYDMIKSFIDKKRFYLKWIVYLALTVLTFIVCYASFEYIKYCEDLFTL